MARVDPLPAFRAILGHEQITTEQLQVLERPTEIPQELALEYFDSVIQATRDVFGIQEFDDEARTGLTLAETRDLMIDFMSYMVSLKKSGNTTPISPQPIIVQEKYSEPIPDTNVSSDLPSTPRESKSDEPLGCC